MSEDGETDPADAFAALSDPTRIAIVRALVDRSRESPSEPSLGFADLRKRVGVRDSGRFRYHLNELRGRFVEQVDDRYRLTYAGMEVGAAILAGTYTDTERVGPVELDSQCPICERGAVGTYDDGTLIVACEDDHRLFQWGLPPNAAAGAEMDELVELATVLVRRAIDLTQAGTCPRCYDAVEPRVVGCDDDVSPGPRLRARCDTCAGRLEAPIGFRLLTVPDVAAFYRRHERRLRDVYIWEHDFVRDEAATRLDDDAAGAVRVEVTMDEETLAVTLDGSGGLVGTATARPDEPGGGRDPPAEADQTSDHDSSSADPDTASERDANPRA